MNENITVTKDTLLEAYKNGDENVKNVFEHLYGKEMFHTKNIMDRVKTFEDAVKELGEDNPLVIQYQKIVENAIPETLARLKLCIITAALNEGWEPKFTKGEYCFYPYFYFHTEEEINRMSEDELANVFVFDKLIGAIAGLAYVYSSEVPSIAHLSVGSRLAFKTEELAKYAGKQFIDIYADWLWRFYSHTEVF